MRNAMDFYDHGFTDKHKKTPSYAFTQVWKHCSAIRNDQCEKTFRDLPFNLKDEEIINVELPKIFNEQIDKNCSGDEIENNKSLVESILESVKAEKEFVKPKSEEEKTEQPKQTHVLSESDLIERPPDFGKLLTESSKYLHPE